MPKLELSDEQIVELILQLPPERQRAVLQMLSVARDAWWQRTIAEGGTADAPLVRGARTELGRDDRRGA